MCAPCKIIFDRMAAARFRDEDIDAAAAEACIEVVDRLAPKIQDDLIANDQWLLTQPEGKLDEARQKWRARLFEVLGEQASLDRAQR